MHQAHFYKSVTLCEECPPVDGRVTPNTVIYLAGGGGLWINISENILLLSDTTPGKTTT